MRPGRLATSLAAIRSNAPRHSPRASRRQPVDSSTHEDRIVRHLHVKPNWRGCLPWTAAAVRGTTIFDRGFVHNLGIFADLPGGALSIVTHLVFSI
jgi:hypothetical protein